MVHFQLQVITQIVYKDSADHTPIKNRLSEQDQTTDVIANQSALHCGVIATGNQWILIRCA